MTILKVRVEGRRIELDVPPDWPDGTEVEIHPLQQETTANGDVLSPEEIAATLAAMNQVEPFELTEAERNALEVERQARKDREKARFVKHADDLGKMWE